MSEQGNTLSTNETSYLEKIADTRISVNMTPREVANFMLKLSSDDEFRSRLEKDPAGVLAEHHIYVPTRDIPLHIVLPPKDVLQQVLFDSMKGREAKIALLPFNVDPSVYWYVSWLAFL